MFQHDLLFNLVKDLLKCIEGVGRSFAVQVQSDRKRLLELSGIRKKYSIHCQFSHKKTRFTLFQHKLLFNLVKDLFKLIEGLGRSVALQVQSERERLFELSDIRKKYSIRCQISR